MKTKKVQIKQLRVRVAGLSRAEGKRLGEILARSLAELPAGNRSQKVPQIVVALRRGTGESLEPLAQRIATNIRSRIR